MLNLRSQAAIIGIGTSGYSHGSDKSYLGLTADALKAALTDAGIGKDDIDGITTHMGTPYGDDYDRIAHALGLNIRHATQYFTHGRFNTLALQNAGLTVATGLADVVACVHTFKAESMSDARWVAKPGETDHEGAREGGGPHGQQPAFGLSSMAAGPAFATRRYREINGLADDFLWPVVDAARQHAALNPKALLSDKALSRDDYLSQGYMMDPLRPLDGAIYGDGSVVVLVSSADRARSLAKPPVYLRGMQGMRSGREEFLLAGRASGIMQQGVGPQSAERYPTQSFDMAGITPADIAAFYTYDVFSPLVLFALERFGHCAPGAAARFVAEGGIAPGGRLPVNTSGGMLAEVHMSGWNSIAEIVLQMRGEAGSRQLRDAAFLQLGQPAGDSIIFGREA